MTQAYNDWHIDEWAASHPGRFIPLAIPPVWDPEALADEVRRVASKGCQAITMPELPHIQGLPSYHNVDYWDPFFRAASEEQVVMCLHIGQGFAAINTAPDAPIDNLIILATQVSTLAAQDLLWGPAFQNYPDLKVAWSEAGIGWIPFYLNRCDRHYHEPDVARPRLRRQAAERHLPRALAGLLRHGSDRAQGPRRHRHRHHRLGVRLPALRFDLPRRARVRARRAGRRRVHRRRDRQDHVAEHLPLLRLGPVPAHLRERRNRRCAASQSPDVDTTIRTKQEWRALYEAQAS